MGSANEAVEKGDGQEPPVGADIPAGKSEATWWPIICVVGIIGLYLGVGLYMYGIHPLTIVSPVLGPVVYVIGVAVVFTGVVGWLYHGFIIDYWERDASEREPYALRAGMLLFLTTDVATFSGGFIYYFFIRSGGWPPGNIPGLLSPTLFVNTVALALSSFTLHFAHKALESGNRRRFLGLLASTIALGVVFVFGQIFEYFGFIIEDGFTFTSGIFGSAFYGLTGLHGLHVLLGTVLLSILLVRGLLGQFSADRDTSVVTVSFYWHFVDAVWFFIISIIYLGSSITTVAHF